MAQILNTKVCSWFGDGKGGGQSPSSTEARAPAVIPRRFIAPCAHACYIASVSLRHTLIIVFLSIVARLICMTCMCITSVACAYTYAQRSRMTRRTASQ